MWESWDILIVSKGDHWDSYCLRTRTSRLLLSPKRIQWITFQGIKNHIWWCEKFFPLKYSVRKLLTKLTSNMESVLFLSVHFCKAVLFQKRRLLYGVQFYIAAKEDCKECIHFDISSFYFEAKMSVYLLFVMLSLFCSYGCKYERLKSFIKKNSILRFLRVISIKFFSDNSCVTYHFNDNLLLSIDSSISNTKKITCWRLFDKKKC